VAITKINLQAVVLVDAGNKIKKKPSIEEKRFAHQKST
jgi:hypothetical protein